MNIATFLGTIFVFVAIAHTVELILFVSRLKSDQPELWKQLGSPDMFSPNGQVSVFKFIFGLTPEVSYPNDGIRAQSTRLRIYALVALGLFIPFCLLAVLRNL